ncbi:MAG: arginine deiminase family protein [Gemmatimonadaceae bacterium]
MKVQVTSEIGALKAVLVHTPGPELLAVTPRTREDFLYDDIIEFETARREHQRFIAILERFTKVFQVRDLLEDVLTQPEVRELFVRETMDIVPSEPLAREIAELEPRQLAGMLIEGKDDQAGLLSKALNETGYELPPLPNLFFTRDSCIPVGDHVLIGSMRYGIRWPEELIMKAIFMHHPDFASRGLLYDGSMERRHQYTIEGGDVHPLREDLVVIGFSERSSPAAIDGLASLLFEKTKVTDVIIVVMPEHKTAIHLDMVFTQLDRELCIVYPPHFIGPERLRVLHWRKGEQCLREPASFLEALKNVAMPLQPVLCGGDKRTLQDREQWASGCNFAAMKPGVVLSYSRNEATLREMERAGYHVVPAVAFLTGETRFKKDERVVITFEGSELVRGGGGPRCMTCPVQRDDPWS